MDLKKWLIAALPLVGLNAACAEPDTITRHVGEFHGRTVHYDASIESTSVLNAKGQPGADVVSISYVDEDQSNRGARPVVFAFNGGPIVASLWLHLGELGPKRINVPADLSAGAGAFRLASNPYCLLDVADLVFFDPASTGFSRVAAGNPPQSYFSVKADGQQTAVFIYDWLVRHQRLQSPVYIVGESYGTMRAAEAAGQLAELPQPKLVDGVVLMGQAVNIIEYAQRRQNIMSYVVSLPSLAAIAWYHQKVDRRGLSLPQFMTEADRFAEEQYLPALFKGKDLAPQEQAKVAAGLESFSGIPAAYYRDHQLRITKQEFRRELLKDRGLFLGEQDARYTSPLLPGGNEEDPTRHITEAFESLFIKYLKEDLRAPHPEDYRLDSPVKGLNDWDWGAATPFSDWPYGERVAQVFKRNAHFRLFLINGFFDLQTTVGASELAAREASWPRDRVWIKAYEGGHMSYTVEASAKLLSEDLRAFLLAPKTQ